MDERELTLREEIEQLVAFWSEGKYACFSGDDYAVRMLRDVLARHAAPVAASATLAVPTCEGFAATWCARCGDCSCTAEQYERGEYSHECPLHGGNTRHGEDHEDSAVAPATRERLPLTEPACGWGDYSGALAEIRDDLAGWPKDARVQRLVAIADAEMAKPSHLDALLSTLAAHPSAAPAPAEPPEVEDLPVGTMEWLRAQYPGLPIAVSHCTRLRSGGHSLYVLDVIGMNDEGRPTRFLVGTDDGHDATRLIRTISEPRTFGEVVHAMCNLELEELHMITSRTKDRP